MLGALVLLSGIALVSHFVRGVTGAGSAIVFNALFVILLATGHTAGLTLHDGLYWMVIANAFGALLMSTWLWRRLTLDRLTAWFMAGMVPVSAVFTVLLTQMDGDALTPLLAVVVSASGIYLAARPRLAPADPTKVQRAALPVGMATGVIGGLFGMGGPITFLFFSAASPNDPGLFRIRLTVITLTTNLLRLGVLASQDVFTAERMSMAAGSLPAVVVGIGLGLWIHRFVRPAWFRVALGVLISVAGLVALMQWAWLG